MHRKAAGGSVMLVELSPVSIEKHMTYILTTTLLLRNTMRLFIINTVSA
jgi:hypothetical protein